MYGYSWGLCICVGAGAADGGGRDGQGHRQCALCVRGPVPVMEFSLLINHSRAHYSNSAFPLMSVK